MKKVTFFLIAVFALAFPFSASLRAEDVSAPKAPAEIAKNHEKAVEAAKKAEGKAARKARKADAKAKKSAFKLNSALGH